MLYKNVLEIIGKTPLVKINSINPYNYVEIYAKLEGVNPGGSIKDRIAQRMIEEAEKSGQLTKEKTIIEPTSGNTGIGLAIVAAIKGYDIEIVMSKAVSIERRKVLEALGARIILSPASEGTDGAIKVTREMVARNPEKYYFCNQYANENNYLAHYHGTAEEIIADMPDITHFAAGLGTSGTLMGNSMRLKEHNKSIQIIAAEPTMNHKIQGLKSLQEAKVPQIFDRKKIDERVIITDEEAFHMTRRLAREEGLFVGMSSGCALTAALKVAKKIKKGKMVVIFPDRGEKYLSTPLFRGGKMGFRIFNTMSRKVEDFVPLVKSKVLMYNCGPTVYNYPHIGNYRAYIFADIIKRYLKYKGYEVRQVMNITDIDDKTIRDSQAQGKSLKEFTEFYTKGFMEDLDILNIDKAEVFPKATENIPEMVGLIKTLLEKGFAYKADDGSIYYSIKKFKNYGRLANINKDNLKAGARVKQDEYKKDNASDFVLWKAWTKDDGDVFWETDLGKGRPGWHIECSAMSMRYLDKSFDIHTGGVDNLFPHHENEIAQSEAANGVTFVNYWMHCEHLLVDGKKMSKSLGNFYTLRDLLEKGFKPAGIRYILFATHFKQQLNFTLEGLKASESAVERLNEFNAKLKLIKKVSEASQGVEKLIVEVKSGFESALDDNLNTSAALAAIFEFIKKINKLMADNRLGQEDSEKIISVMKKFDSVLGIMSSKEEVLDSDIEVMIEKREEARKTKDFATADKIRDELKAKGLVLKDTKDGVRWEKA